jgi:hypothetical protein
LKGTINETSVGQLKFNKAGAFVAQGRFWTSKMNIEQGLIEDASGKKYILYSLLEFLIL